MAVRVASLELTMPDIVDQLIPANWPSLIRGQAIAEALDVSVTTIIEMGRDGRLPPPVRISARLFLYPRDEVREAIRRMRQEAVA
jgi:predicted DNA-binding transcriptional regulator AlpA